MSTYRLVTAGKNIRVSIVIIAEEMRYLRNEFKRHIFYYLLNDTF